MILLAPARGAWRAAIVLMVAMTLSYVDRTLPGVLLEPIRAEMGLTDTQLSLLTGLSFALCYAVMVAPLSWAADRFSRRLVITAGLVTWSGMTALAGFAQGFWPLFICRMGVGLGEAALVPAAYALLADLFPARLVPRGLAVMTLGIPFGIAAGFAVGGLVHDVFAATALPSGLSLSAWRATFVVVGASGLALSPFTATMPEPRHRLVVSAQRQEAPRDRGEFQRFLKQSAGFVVCLAAGMTFVAMGIGGALSWMAPFFARAHGWSVGQAGSAIGVLALATGLVGAPLAAVIVEKASNLVKRDSILLVLGTFTLLATPFAILGPLASSPWVSLVCISVTLLTAAGVSAVAPAAMVNTCPPLLRARASAVYVVSVGLIGTGAGPTSFGLFTDYVMHDPAGLPVSLSVVGGVFLIGATVMLFAADRWYGPALTRTRASASPPD